ncbi:hypothetical protein [Mycetohabitans sp. B46]|uniref:hypothetical protein n=1 Tax=Mycetohabitans sp. B46 TaxID=2772536 RepID=UPI00307EC87B
MPNHATLIIDAKRVDFVDREVRATLQAFVADAPRRGMTIEMLHWPPRCAPTRPRLGGPAAGTRVVKYPVFSRILP